MKAKKSVALLLAILTISSAAACNVAPVDTVTAMEPARPANPLMEGASEANGTDSGESTASSVEIPEGVTPYTPYDLSGKSITVYTAEGELSNAVLAQRDRFTELTGLRGGNGCHPHGQFP